MIKIHIDYDGVLVDFESRACKLLGIDITNSDVRKFLKENSPNGLELMVGKKAFWKAIYSEGEAFWTGLELFPWSLDFYTRLKVLAQGELFILTSPPTDPCGASGKVKSITKFFKTRNYLIGAPKHAVASSSALLIDDTPKKINKFIEYGGHGYLFPHALRVLDGEISIDDIYNNIEILIEEMKL